MRTFQEFLATKMPEPVDPSVVMSLTQPGDDPRQLQNQTNKANQIAMRTRKDPIRVAQAMRFKHQLTGPDQTKPPSTSGY